MEIRDQISVQLPFVTFSELSSWAGFVRAELLNEMQQHQRWYYWTTLYQNSLQIIDDPNALVSATGQSQCCVKIFLFMRHSVDFRMVFSLFLCQHFFVMIIGPVLYHFLTPRAY